MRRRVVITGMGVVTPLGHTVGELFASQVEGRTAVGTITRFDAHTFPTTFASEVKGFELGKYIRDAAKYHRCGTNTQFALAAGKQALEDAGLLDLARGDRSRMGVYLGSGEGGDDFKNLIARHRRGEPQGGSRPGQPCCLHEPDDGPPRWAVGGRAGDVHAGGIPGRCLRARGPEPGLPDGLCGQLAGHRRSARHHPLGRCRRDARGRVAQHDPPARDQRFQPAHRSLAAQRQPADRQPPVRPDPRRVRDRRGRGPRRAGRARTRTEAQSVDLCRAGGLRLNGGCVPHDRSAPAGPRRDTLHGRGHRRREPGAEPISATSTPTARALRPTTRPRRRRSRPSSANMPTRCRSRVRSRCSGTSSPRPGWWSW